MTKKIFLGVLMFVTFVSMAFADGTKQFLTSASMQNTLREEGPSLTPLDRIRRSELKVRENPSLRGRRNPKSRQPASEGSTLHDNLTDKILSDFREDETISKIPAKIKVSSKSGVVTLDGVVNNAQEQSLIENKVSKIAGVKKVVNRLKVKTSDQDLLD